MQRLDRPWFLDVSEDEEDADEITPHKLKKIRCSKTESQNHQSDEDSDGQ